MKNIKQKIKQSRDGSALNKILAAFFADEILFPDMGTAVQRRNWNGGM